MASTAPPARRRPELPFPSPDQHEPPPPSSSQKSQARATAYQYCTDWTWSSFYNSFSALTLLVGSSDPRKTRPRYDLYNAFGGTLNPAQLNSFYNYAARPTAGQRSSAMRLSVRARFSASISRKPCVQTSPNILCMLPWLSVLLWWRCIVL